MVRRARKKFLHNKRTPCGELQTHTTSRTNYHMPFSSRPGLPHWACLGTRNRGAAREGPPRKKKASHVETGGRSTSRGPSCLPLWPQPAETNPPTHPRRSGKRPAEELPLQRWPVAVSCHFDRGAIWQAQLRRSFRWGLTRSGRWRAPSAPLFACQASYGGDGRLRVLLFYSRSYCFFVLGSCDSLLSAKLSETG